MENNKPPDWFYVLFDNISKEHNLSIDLKKHHLEVGEGIYFKILSDFDNGRQDMKKIILQSFENLEIGNLYVDNKDELMRMGNGNQFLFLEEFQKELYKSISAKIEVDNGKLIPKTTKMNNLTHKQQVLLLEKIGVFDLPQILNLTDIQKGILFGKLLGLNSDNTENYIRYRKGKQVASQYNIKTESNLQKVNEILKEVGLEK